MFRGHFHGDRSDPAGIQRNPPELQHIRQKQKIAVQIKNPGNIGQKRRQNQPVIRRFRPVAPVNPPVRERCGRNRDRNQMKLADRIQSTDLLKIRLLQIPVQKMEIQTNPLFRRIVPMHQQRRNRGTGMRQIIAVRRQSKIDRFHSAALFLLPMLKVSFCTVSRYRSGADGQSSYSFRSSPSSARSIPADAPARTSP